MSLAGNAVLLLLHDGPLWADVLALGGAVLVWPLRAHVASAGGVWTLASGRAAVTADTWRVRGYAFWGGFGWLELECGPRLWLWPDALSDGDRRALRRWLAIHGPDRQVR